MQIKKTHMEVNLTIVWLFEYGLETGKNTSFRKKLKNASFTKW